uniref:hypothetical protein n=1 Tax=Salmonella enterica TaxID=28901 RepID=UPI0035246D81
MTILSEDTILLDNSVCAHFIKDQILNKSSFAQFYKFVEHPASFTGPANVLYINGFLVYPIEFEDIYKD